jgi:hypothetical protein
MEKIYPLFFLAMTSHDSHSVLKTVEPELKPAGLIGLMVDRFKPVNKPNWSSSS